MVAFFVVIRHRVCPRVRKARIRGAIMRGGAILADQQEAALGLTQKRAERETLCVNDIDGT